MPLAAAVDRIIFIKKGFSLWKHVIPFSIAALLLVVGSLPADNLLLKLVKVLEQPGWVWIPAALLTIVACSVYGITVYVQVRRSYLWTDGVLGRSITTALLYLILCTLMAYGVLRSTTAQPISWGIVWACLLLSVLSLTGIGWSGPDSWAESIGVVYPDYTQARAYAKNLKDLVERERNKASGEQSDIENFINTARSLAGEIEKNISLEPDWANHDLEVVSKDVQELINYTRHYFPTEEKAKYESFPTACNFEIPSLYPGFVKALKTLSSYWFDWKYSQRRQE